MVEIRQYIRSDGSCPFRKWFDSLAAAAAARAATAMAKLQNGIGDVKPVGGGVATMESNWSLLLAGGSKRGQQRDIGFARVLWDEYKQRKRALTRKAAERKGMT
jgi:putative component of toxin-antitoxin plasmid stabilization module